MKQVTIGIGEGIMVSRVPRILGKIDSRISKVNSNASQPRKWPLEISWTKKK